MDISKMSQNVKRVNQNDFYNGTWALKYTFKFNEI